MITQEELKKLLHYDGETGQFTWLVGRGPVKCGSIACSIKKNRNGKSYVYIKINQKMYTAHRLVFLYLNGKFPELEVDHLNGDGTDNRVSNLREATKEENNKNLRIYSNNKSGICGVKWNKALNKWQSYVREKGKFIHIGLYESIFEAACARKSAELIYNFHKNHGSARPL